MKKAFSAFVLVGVLNLAFSPTYLTYAEEPTPSSNEEVAVVESSDAASTTDSATDVSNDVNSTDSVIDTGDAVSSVDVSNQVSTNVVNSNGGIIVESGSLGDNNFDVRTSSSTPDLNASTTCSSCETDISVQNQSTSTLVNNIDSSATTGNNNASSTGESIVVTGDAYSGVNLVNIVNTNIVESNYLLLVFNNFGDWSGDLVFPNGDFFAKFLSMFAPGSCNCGGDISISNSNNATVSNTVNATSSTGDNNSEDGLVVTGSSYSGVNIYNDVNRNIYRDSSVKLLIRVLGDWDGSIFNLPSGMAWQRTPEGIILYNENLLPFATTTKSEQDFSINNNSLSSVFNNINSSSNTGGNTALGSSNTIVTGDAYSGVNLVNIVDTNIISSNWMRAFVNILGNWTGNISFGQPDLWVGTVASVDGVIDAGMSVHFTTTVKNNGDAKASNILAKAMLRSSHFLLSGDVEEAEWNLGDLAPGQGVQFSYYGTVDRYLPNDGSQIAIESKVSSFETDANNKDNIDLISFSAGYHTGPTPVLPSGVNSTSYPDLVVTKTHNIPSSVIVNGEVMLPHDGSVDYKVVVNNNGGRAYEGVLVDELRDQDGNVINSQSWDLDEILPGEEIVVTYTTEFSSGLKAGTYTNYAWVDAVGGSTSSIGGNIAQSADSNIASTKVVKADKFSFQATDFSEIGEVLGSSIIKKSMEELPVVSSEEQEDLGGFCEYVKEEPIKNKLSILDSAFLGLSFILLMQRSKKVRDALNQNIPTMLF